MKESDAPSWSFCPSDSFFTHLYFWLSINSNCSTELFDLQVGDVHFDGRKRNLIDSELHGLLLAVDCHLQLRSFSDLPLLRLCQFPSAPQRSAVSLISSSAEAPRIFIQPSRIIDISVTENKTELNPAVAPDVPHSFVESSHIYFQSASVHDRGREQSCRTWKNWPHRSSRLKSVCGDFYFLCVPLFELQRNPQSLWCSQNSVSFKHFWIILLLRLIRKLVQNGSVREQFSGPLARSHKQTIELFWPNEKRCQEAQMWKI